MEIVTRQKVVATTIAGLVVLGLIALICLSILPTFSYGSDVGNFTKVTVVNNTPGTMVGIVRFVEDDEGNLIDFVTLGTWDAKERNLYLKPGKVYGITHYDCVYDKILYYTFFRVLNEPLTIVFG